MLSKPSKTRQNSKAKATAVFEHSFEAIGTVWQVEVFDAAGDITKKQAAPTLHTLHQRIEAFDKAYSRFRNDSLVSRMGRQAGKYTLPNDAKPMIELYRQLYDITNGAMTPLIGQTLDQAGYDADYSFKPQTVQAPPTWENTLLYNPPDLTLTQPALLDFGAAGKGYLVDLIGEIFDADGFKSYCINAGGDILYRTSNGQKLDVALEHPDDTSQAIGVANIHNQSLCGSAGNRRAWATYHHIIDPRTLESPRHIKALWIVAETTLLADALSTALFFASPDKLQKAYNFEYAIMYDDHSLERSSSFPATFFTT